MSTAESRTATFGFPSGITLRITSSQRELLNHFRAEYGEGSAQRDAPPDIDVYAGRAAVESSPEPRLLARGFAGRHKVLRWRVGFAGVDKDTTTVAFDGSGQMVISFLQTFYVEPLLRLKFAARDHALVHAACIVEEGRSVLFPAGSAVGKSTLTLQHAAAGKAVQGDNYVILTADGRTLPFPRRMRVYSDLQFTAPEVFRQLPRAEQRRLKLAGVLKRLSAGYSNQPRRLTVQQMLPGSPACPEARLRSVFLLKPYVGEGLSQPSAKSPDEAIGRIQEIGGMEAKYLEKALAAGGVPSDGFMEQAIARERQVLAEALADVPVFEVLVPRVKDPAPVAAGIRRLASMSA